MKWRGISYCPLLSHRWIKWIWRRVCCPKEWHLFDEVQGGDGHYLHCDACQLSLFLKALDDKA